MLIRISFFNHFFQPFEMRKGWFYENLRKGMPDTPFIHVSTQEEHILFVNRGPHLKHSIICNISTFFIILTERLFKTSCEHVTKKDVEILKRNISIKFEGEEGVVRLYFSLF